VVKVYKPRCAQMWSRQGHTVCMAQPDPTPPRAAAIGGRVLEMFGWVIVALAAGLIVLQVIQASVSIAGIVLALFVAVAGGATVSVGRAVERSRAR